MANAKKAGAHSVKELLGELKAFAIELVNNAGPPGAKPIWSSPVTMFSTQEYGGLFLTGDESVRYHRIIGGLRAEMGEAMSEASVTKLVQTAILKTFDLRKRSQSVPVGARADQAVEEARIALSSPHLKWVSCIPMLGITPPRKPWDLGNVKLIDIAGKEGKAFLKAARRVIESTRSSAEDKAAMTASTRKELIGDHPGQAFALVTTLALDANAAWASAKRRLRFTLDCLNFAMDVLHGHLQHYELTDEEPRRRHYASGLTLNATDLNSTLTHSELNPGVGTLDTEEFRQHIRKSRALRTLCEYLRTQSPNKHQQRVLAAANWAGRAGAEQRAEQAFLFRAIALESLILGDGENIELTRRLTLSIVHLLGNWLKDRKDASRKLKALYGVRSKIVHSGTYEVDDDDTKLMRGFVIKTFVRILADKRFAKMAGKNDLDEWFEARMRGDK